MIGFEHNLLLIIDASLQGLEPSPTPTSPPDLEWVTTLIAVVLLLMPGITSLFLRPQRDDVDHAHVRRLRIQLWIATAILLAAFFVLQAMASGPFETWPGWLQWWSQLHWTINGGALPHKLMWLCTFPLMFVFVTRLMRVLGWMDAPHTEQSTRRTAQLVNRVGKNPIPKAAWLAHALVWVVGVGLLVAALLAQPGTHGSRTIWVGLATMVCFVGPLVAFTPWIVRKCLTEAEPLDASGHPELRAAYAKMRSTRAWGFYGLSLAMILLFSTTFAISAWVPEAGWFLGLVGGAGGAVIGTCGGIFGAKMGSARMRANRLLRSLEDAAPQSHNVDDTALLSAKPTE